MLDLLSTRVFRSNLEHSLTNFGGVKHVFERTNNSILTLAHSHDNRSLYSATISSPPPRLDNSSTAQHLTFTCSVYDITRYQHAQYFLLMPSPPASEPAPPRRAHSLLGHARILPAPHTLPYQTSHLPPHLTAISSPPPGPTRHLHR